MQFSMVEMWAHMGGVARAVVYLLGLMSVATLTIALERLWVFGLAVRESRGFAGLLEGALLRREFGELLSRRDAFPRSPLAQVAVGTVDEYVRGLEARGRGASYDVVAAATRRCERGIEREGERLRRGLGVLATVGSTAPFVGLFGTVFGIINSFQAMGVGQGDLATIGPGIAEALLTTALGIAVAIVGVWFYNLQTARVDAMTAALEGAKRELVDFLIKDEGRPRAGG